MKKKTRGQAFKIEVEKHQEEKLEALIAEFQKSGDSQEVAAVKAYNSLLPLYREELRDVLLENLKSMHALQKDPIYQKVVATRDKFMVRIHRTGHS